MNFAMSARGLTFLSDESENSEMQKFPRSVVSPARLKIVPSIDGFVYRENADGTFDSICLRCCRTWDQRSQIGFYDPLRTNTFASHPTC
jgi:hypothetical protein